MMQQRFGTEYSDTSSMRRKCYDVKGGSHVYNDRSGLTKTKKNRR